jgi:hypothetical protein
MMEWIVVGLTAVLLFAFTCPYGRDDFRAAWRRVTRRGGGRS